MTVLVAAVSLAACARGRYAPMAESATPEIAIYRIPWPDAFPSDVAVDADGRVWFTDRVRSFIGRFDPTTLEFRAFVTPSPRSAPYGLIAAPDGSLWYAGSRAGVLGEVDPTTGAISEHRLAGASGGPHLLAMSGPMLWFSLREAGAWGRYDTRTAEVRLFAAPPRLRPYSVAVGAGGEVWMSVYEGYEMLRIDTATNAVTVVDLSVPLTPEGLRRYAEYPDSVRRRLPMRERGEARRIAVGPDGSLWVTDHLRGRVTRFDPETWERVHFNSPYLDSRPYGIVVDSAGVWFVESGSARLVHLNPLSGERSEWPLPSHAAVRHIVVDARRGRVWLPLSDAGLLGLLEIGN